MEITNTAPGIRGLHTKSGVVYFKPGQTRSVEFADAKQEKRAAQLGFKGVKTEKQEKPPAKPADTVLDDLRAQAEELGIDVDGRWGEDRLKAEIDKALAD